MVVVLARQAGNRFLGFLKGLLIRALLTRAPLMFVQLMNTKLGEKYPPIVEPAENNLPMRTLDGKCLAVYNDSGSHAVPAPFINDSRFSFSAKM